MSARPIGSPTGRVTLGECIAAIDAAHRRAEVEIIGNPDIATAVRNAVADIFDPQYRILRRLKLRNGPSNQVTE